MPERVSRKWRPGLGLVLGCTLAATLCLPFFGIGAVAYLCGSGSAPMSCANATALVTVLVLVTTAYVGYVLWRILLRPITGLADRAERVKAGDDSALTPLGHYGTREMGEMGQAILDMGRVLQGREAVLRSYADHVTHELKSPLTVLRGAAELLDSDDLPPEERRRLLTRIDEAADRMTALLDAQRALARAQEPFAAGSARLGPIVAELAADYPDLELELALDAEVPLEPDGLRLVLGHLVGNAADHGAGKVRIMATPEHLEVSDDGPGISPGNAARVFDPFFTTRRDSGGTGMGLPIVRRMLEAHGATIRLAEAETGARFVVEF